MIDAILEVPHYREALAIGLIGFVLMIPRSIDLFRLWRGRKEET